MGLMASLPTRPLQLTTLETLVKANNVKAAILLLQCKNRLEIPSTLKIPHVDTVFGLNHTLDYLCITPKSLGFSVILPPDDFVPGFNWEFCLELNLPLKPLKGKVRDACFFSLR